MGEKDEVKKADGPTMVTLKLDLHCEGCAKKVKRAVKHFEGVVDVEADATSNKLTVTGSMDPNKLRLRIEDKIGKKVELLSQPAAKKDRGKDGDIKKPKEKPAEKKKKSEEKKPKEDSKKAPMSTVVLKIRLHCDGCTQKIKKVIKKTKGVESVGVDEAKDLVTINGTMDPKELITYLKNKLRRNVEVAPSKKKEGGSEKKEKETKNNKGGGEKKEKDTSGYKKKKGSDGGSGENKATDDRKSKGVNFSNADSKKSYEVKAKVSKMEYYDHPQHSYYNALMYHGYVSEGYRTPPHYNQGYNFEHGSNSNQGYTTQIYANQSYSTPSYTQTYPNHNHVVEYSHEPSNMYYHEPPQEQYLHPPPTPYVHAPQMFSDENPNACSVM